MFKVRIEGDTKELTNLAEYFKNVTEMTAKFDLINQSKVYLNRDSKEQGRIYLTFVKR